LRPMWPTRHACAHGRTSTATDEDAS